MTATLSTNGVPSMLLTPPASTHTMHRSSSGRSRGKDPVTTPRLAAKALPPDLDGGSHGTTRYASTASPPEQPNGGGGGEVIYRRMKSPTSDKATAASYYGSMYLNQHHVSHSQTHSKAGSSTSGGRDGGGGDVPEDSTVSYLGHRPEMDVATAVAMAGYTYPYKDAVLHPYRKAPLDYHRQSVNGEGSGRVSSSHSVSASGSRHGSASGHRQGPGLSTKSREPSSNGHSDPRHRATYRNSNLASTSVRYAKSNARASKDHSTATSFGNPQNLPGALALLDQMENDKAESGYAVEPDVESDDDDIYHFRSDAPATDHPPSHKDHALPTIGGRSGSGRTGQSGGTTNSDPTQRGGSSTKPRGLYLPTAVRTSAATYRREVSARKGVPQPPSDFSRTLPKTTKVYRGEVIDDRPEWRPGLGHTCKRGWQDFCLNLRFWWFRTSRKIARMVESH